MRVALFSGNYNYVRDGSNQALNKLVAQLEREAGCEVWVFSPVTGTPAFEPAGTLIPVPSIALPLRSEFRVALGIPKQIRRAISPDIIPPQDPGRNWAGETGADDHDIDRPNMISRRDLSTIDGRGRGEGGRHESARPVTARILN